MHALELAIREIIIIKLTHSKSSLGHRRIEGHGKANYIVRLVASKTQIQPKTILWRSATNSQNTSEPMV